MPRYPFEAAFEEIRQDADGYVAAVFACLESEFLVMPKGAGFVAYPTFESGYEALKAATKGFCEFNPADVLPVALADPISIVVLRTMLGFTPPEWAYVTTRRTGVNVAQGFVRTIDRKIRMSPQAALKASGETKKRLAALVQTACLMLSEGTS